MLILLQTQSVYPCDEGAESVDWSPLVQFLKKCHRPYNSVETMRSSLDFLANNSYVDFSGSKGVHREFIDFRENLLQYVRLFLRDFLQLRARRLEIFLELYTLLDRNACLFDQSDDDEEESVLQEVVQCKSVEDALQNLWQCIRNNEDLVSKNKQYLNQEKENIIVAVSAKSCAEELKRHLEHYDAYLINSQKLMKPYSETFEKILYKEQNFSQSAEFLKALPPQVGVMQQLKRKIVWTLVPHVAHLMNIGITRREFVLGVQSC
ncbi:MAG: hypothetical protein OXC30_06725 [Alphaproteobacteria bacterium]|nr:hypothetical protein [Alphaproteobacteria bacterium]